MGTINSTDLGIRTNNTSRLFINGGNHLLFEISAPNYKTKQVIQTVKRGRKVSIIVQLDPQ